MSHVNPDWVVCLLCACKYNKDFKLISGSTQKIVYIVKTLKAMGWTVFFIWILFLIECLCVCACVCVCVCACVWVRPGGLHHASQSSACDDHVWWSGCDDLVVMIWLWWSGCDDLVVWSCSLLCQSWLLSSFSTGASHQPVLQRRAGTMFVMRHMGIKQTKKYWEIVIILGGVECLASSYK